MKLWLPQFHKKTSDLNFNSLFPEAIREGTKTGDPDEFDYLLILTELKDACEVVEDDCPPSFVRLKVKPEYADRFVDFVDEKTGLLESNKVAKCIYTKIHASLPVVFLNSSQQGEACSSFFFTKEVTHKLSNVLTFEFEFVSATYKKLIVSVDLVPAVNIAPFKPKGASLPDGELPPLLAINQSAVESQKLSNLVSPLLIAGRVFID